MTKIQALATALVAFRNCVKSGNTAWRDRWADRIDAIERSLPHGSGLDGDVEIDREWPARKEILVTFDYHHMNGDGFYVGWSRHVMAIYPEFDGISVRIDPHVFAPGIEIDDWERDCLYDYLSELFHANLSEPWSFEPWSFE
jgi:hypothetical protein